MSVWLSPTPFGWERLVEEALQEDIGTGDLTSAMFPEDKIVKWYIEAQSLGTVCGAGIVEYLMTPNQEGSLEMCIRDGQHVHPGTIVAKGALPAIDLLQYERTALNFLMHLSGVATATRHFVDRVAHTKAKIADTRKTLPGLRLLQKYAVRCGGGINHRMGLYDAVMIKDNHIQAYGSITGATQAIRSTIGHMVKVEVECDREDQVAEAIESGCEVIMLDNMEPETMQRIVQLYQGRAIFEASGGVNLESVQKIAEAGVNVISVGAVTHSVKSVSYHLELS